MAEIEPKEAESSVCNCGDIGVSEDDYASSAGKSGRLVLNAHKAGEEEVVIMCHGGVIKGRCKVGIASCVYEKFLDIPFRSCLVIWITGQFV